MRMKILLCFFLFTILSCGTQPVSKVEGQYDIYPIIIKQKEIEDTYRLASLGMYVFNTCCDCNCLAININLAMPDTLNILELELKMESMIEKVIRLFFISIL